MDPAGVTEAVREMEADIAEGALVTFETERGQRGLNAVNIAYAK